MTPKNKSSDQKGEKSQSEGQQTSAAQSSAENLEMASQSTSSSETSSEIQTSAAEPSPTEQLDANSQAQSMPPTVAQLAMATSESTADSATSIDEPSSAKEANEEEQSKNEGPTESVYISPRLHDLSEEADVTEQEPVVEESVSSPSHVRDVKETGWRYKDMFDSEGNSSKDENDRTYREERMTSRAGNGHKTMNRPTGTSATRVLLNRIPNLGPFLFERKSIYFIRGLKDPLDPSVAECLEDLSIESQNDADQARDEIARRGLSDEVQKVTDSLNGSGLEDLPRLLLSKENLYAALLKKVLFGEIVLPSDTRGVGNAIKRNVDETCSEFLARVIDSVLERRSTRLSDDQLERLLGRAERGGLPLTAGKTGPAIVALLNDLEREGDVPHYINLYVKRKEIPERLLTSAVLNNMGNYLRRLGVVFKDDAAVEAGDYDEYFALAYHHALERSAGADDPLDAANTKGAVSEWDFSLDAFDSFDDQVVIPANIKAAGALYYNFFIGEVMRVYAIADALVLRWASAALDIPDGPTAAALYRYYKKREDRATPAERAMLYKRVFNMGDAQLLSRMVANEEFEGLWYRLMSEVAEYIRKREDNSSEIDKISRTRIFQATKELQYNLTEHMTGMAHLQVAEMHAHLQEAIEILKSDDVIDHFGGRRKNMFRVIERIAAEDMHTTIPTSLIRTMAVEGAAILQNWVAVFDQRTYTEDQLQVNLLDPGEACIIAQASLENNGEAPDEEETDSDIENKGDFNDWES